MRKGIGNVIGTAIFLLIALSLIGLMVIAYYNSEYFGVQNAQVAYISSQKNKESLSIGVVLPQGTITPSGHESHGNAIGICTGTAKTTQVVTISSLTVTNDGNVGTEITWVILTELINNNYYLIGVYKEDVQIAPGQTVTVTLPRSVTISGGQVYNFTLVTLYGNSYTVQVIGQFCGGG